MTLFILGIILLVATIILILFKRTTMEGGDPYSRPPIPPSKVTHRLPWYYAAGVGTLALLAIVASFVTTVDSKNVGVLRTFGAVSDRTLHSGLSVKLPWQQVTEIDGTVQVDEYKGDDCIYALIGDGARACISLTNRWRINAENADKVYQDYRSDDPTDQFRSAVISTQLKSVVQDVAAGYNPVGQFQTVSGEEATSKELKFTPDYAAMSTDIEKQLNERLGDEPLADIIDVTVSFVDLPKETQKKIDAFTKEVGNTRVAAQKKETAVQEAAANNTLRESLKDEPGLMTSKCLDSVAEAIERGYQFNAGFSCFGGSGAVVVPSGK